MLRSYLKIAIRSLQKNRLFSMINVAGLGLGIATFLLIFEYVSFEKGVNQFHTNLPSLYRILESKPTGEVFEQQAPAVAPLLQREFSDIKAYCRIAQGLANGIVAVGGTSTNDPLRSFREERVAYADGSFFTLFTFPLLSGNAASAISQPNTVAISATTARKYFDVSNAIGKTIVVNNQFGKTLYTVSAVFQDMPENSDLRFDAVLSLQTLANPANLNGNSWARLDGFDGSFINSFILLTDQSNASALESKMNGLKQKLDPENKSVFVLQSVSSMHLGASLDDPNVTSGSLSFVYLLTGIAVLILVIAWFNYVNLSTAASLKRAREVGVRKVVGAGRFQLVGQFLGESFLLNVIGFGLGLVIVSVVQKSFNDFTQKSFSLLELLTDPAWMGAAALLVLGAFLSGSYVAFSVASLPPAQILKGSQELKSGKSNWLRQVLVVAQFSVSVVLIIATIVFYNQLQFMQMKDLGFKAAQRLVINGPQLGDPRTLAASSAALDDQVSALPYVEKLSHTGTVPGNYYSFNASGIVRLGEKPDADKRGYAMAIVDDRYLSVFDIPLAAGRNFTVREAELTWEKSHKLMVNESAARQLGFAKPAKAVGAMISWGEPYEIVGVVKDYNHQGLQKAIDPIIFMPRRSGGRLVLKISTTNMPKQLRELESRYKAAYPGNPFEYFFVDQKYDEQYKTERQYSQVFAMASLLAILIACLGLFGLASYVTEQRTKEIGIRKVLGASIASILTLVSKDFLTLVVVSILIACPLAGYLMDKWLADFAYRTAVSWWIFACAGALVTIIALLTVGWQSLKAALTNPVQSLRAD